MLFSKDLPNETSQPEVYGSQLEEFHRGESSAGDWRAKICFDENIKPNVSLRPTASTRSIDVFVFSFNLGQGFLCSIRRCSNFGKPLGISDIFIHQFNINFSFGLNWLGSACSLLKDQSPKFFRSRFSRFASTIALN